MQSTQINPLPDSDCCADDTESLCSSLILLLCSALMFALALILCWCIILRCFSSAATEFSKVGAAALSALSAFSAFLALLVSAAVGSRAAVGWCACAGGDGGGGGEVEGGSVLIFVAVVLDFALLSVDEEGEEVPYLWLMKLRGGNRENAFRCPGAGEQRFEGFEFVREFGKKSKEKTLLD